MLLRKVGEKEYLFKVYNAKDIRLTPGMRLPVEMTIAGKNAMYDGKPVLSTDPNYADAEKWFAGTKSGVSIRTPPVARALPVEEPKSSSSKKSSTPAAMPAPAPAPTAETGIFLAREDIEELFALVRKGSKLSLVR